MDLREELIDYYSKKSKHSNYQVLPSALRKIIGENEVTVKSRQEQERLEYILNNVDIKNKTVIDIGGNTGFFVFELLEAGAKYACLYEGNSEHTKFVELARDAVGIEEGRLEVKTGYYTFTEDLGRPHYDVGVLLNVLHHFGDDYGSGDGTIDDTKRHIIQQLRSMSRVVDILVFQLGFNSYGDVSRPLFAGGTKKEMIDFITEGVKGVWNIKAVGIAERLDGSIMYNNLSDDNIQRNDTLGEFLNRPLFILEAVS